MPDPVTIGAVIATALATGAAQGATAIASAAIADAYAGLKGLARRLLGDSVEKLEEKPDSETRRAMVADLADDQPEAQRAELLRLADALRAALEAEGKGASLGAVYNQFNAGRDQYIAQGGGTQNIDQRGRHG